MNIKPIIMHNYVTSTFGKNEYCTGWSHIQDLVIITSVNLKSGNTSSTRVNTSELIKVDEIYKRKKKIKKIIKNGYIRI